MAVKLNYKINKAPEFATLTRSPWGSKLPELSHRFVYGRSATGYRRYVKHTNPHHSLRGGKNKCAENSKMKEVDGQTLRGQLVCRVGRIGNMFGKLTQK